MKHNLLIILIISIFTISTTQKVFSQADTLLNFCSNYLPYPYISDGQQYRTLLNTGETAEFYATFYGGTTYRIVACAGISEGNLIFNLYDKDRNMLFSSKDNKNTPFWDFKFTSTVDCIIEAQLDERGPASGFAIILIGFKQ